MLCPCPVPSTSSLQEQLWNSETEHEPGETVLINRKQLIIIIVGLRIIRGCRAQPHTYPPNTHRAPEGKVTPCQDGKFLSRFVINPHYIAHFPWPDSAGIPGKPFATDTASPAGTACRTVVLSSVLIILTQWPPVPPGV